MAISNYQINLLHLSEVDSTNAWLRSNLSNYTHGFVVSTDYQTTGKGQASNVWESERGSNLLFSLLLEPTKIPIKEQFILSQLVSISIVNVLRNLLNKEVRIKWPNDIYVDNKKLCGILIENTIIDSQMAKAIIGIGLNVNQQIFTSDAPNPVSMHQLCGNSLSPALVLKDIVTEILKDYDAFIIEQSKSLQETYFSLLYRNKGYHLFQTQNLLFEAEIDSILPTGPIRLRTKKGEYKLFAFKEVQFVLAPR